MVGILECDHQRTANGSVEALDFADVGHAGLIDLHEALIQQFLNRIEG